MIMVDILLVLPDLCVYVHMHRDIPRDRLFFRDIGRSRKEVKCFGSREGIFIERKAWGEFYVILQSKFSSVRYHEFFIENLPLCNFVNSEACFWGGWSASTDSDCNAGKGHSTGGHCIWAKIYSPPCAVTSLCTVSLLSLPSF